MVAPINTQCPIICPGFRRNFPFNQEWAGKGYATKQVEAYAVEENAWLVITVMVKFC